MKFIKKRNDIYRMFVKGIKMKKEIQETLLQIKEESYQKFTESLTPGANKILGIRIPILRSMAKELCKGDWEEVLSYEGDIYFEETMLRGMIISYGAKDMDKALPYIEDFIPRVDNWAVCDSVFMGMKVLQKDRERTFSFIMSYFHSGKEFYVRVSLLIMMQHLLKCDEHGKTIPRKRNVTVKDMNHKEEIPGKYIIPILELLNREFQEGYYASMAASWLVAECFCIFPYHTTCFLKSNPSMGKETYNKAIQKICESRIPEDEVKALLRQMKR